MYTVYLIGKSSINYVKKSVKYLLEQKLFRLSGHSVTPCIWIICLTVVKVTVSVTLNEVSYSKVAIRWIIVQLYGLCSNIL